MNISVVIRTLNEETHLGALLAGIHDQQTNHEVEIVVIDSGSTDNTLAIVSEYSVRVTHIDKAVFSFGRSLNEGSAFATGDVLVFISGHCIPVNETWLDKLVEPLALGQAGYSYGRQLGAGTTKFSEEQVFANYFPPDEDLKRVDYFCNNANAAILRTVWEKYKFDEEITGLEDMELAKRYVKDGGKVQYVPASAVFHIHDENWFQVRRRYEREALALRNITPEIQLSAVDASAYFCASLFYDFQTALREGCFWKQLVSIIKYRSAQFSGSYLGSKVGREISFDMKQRYFYPRR